MHVGEPIHEEEDYFGRPVVIAARLCGRAGGGQILASQLVRDLLGARIKHTLRDLGRLELKGLTEPLAACEVVWEETAPVSLIALQPWLAKAETTAFVGRTEDLARLRDAWAHVQAGERKLVLIAGEPGIGKTRLAAEFARAVHAEGATVLLGRSSEETLIAAPALAALRERLVAKGSSRISEARRLAGAFADALADERVAPLVEVDPQQQDEGPDVADEGEDRDEAAHAEQRRFALYRVRDEADPGERAAGDEDRAAHRRLHGQTPGGEEGAFLAFASGCFVGVDHIGLERRAEHRSCARRDSEAGREQSNADLIPRTHEGEASEQPRLGHERTEPDPGLSVSAATTSVY